MGAGGEESGGHRCVGSTGKESALCPQDLDMTQGGGEVPFSIPEPG